MPKKGSINPARNAVSFREVVDQDTGEVKTHDIYVNGKRVTSQQQRDDTRQLAEAFRRPAKDGYTLRVNGMFYDVINQKTGAYKGSYHESEHAEAEKVVNKLNKMVGYESTDSRDD